MDYTELIKELRESPANKRLMIYAANAIEELQERLITTETDLSDFKDAMAWKEHFDILSEQDCKPRWIPVTERLPETDDILGGLYLCHHVSGKYGQLSWQQLDYWSGEKFVFKKDSKHDHITHWMPLPEPPKEETE